MAQLTLLKGYPDYIGKRLAWCGDQSGPNPYVTGGDPTALPQYQNYIDSIHGSISLSGTYYVRALPSGSGARATWKLKWIVAATNTEVANGVDLSAETVRLDGFGGVY